MHPTPEKCFAQNVLMRSPCLFPEDFNPAVLTHCLTLWFHFIACQSEILTVVEKQIPRNCDYKKAGTINGSLLQYISIPIQEPQRGYSILSIL